MTVKTKEHYNSLAKKYRKDAKPLSAVSEVYLEMATRYEKISKSSSGACTVCSGDGIEPGTHGRGTCHNCQGRGYTK